MKPSVWTGRPSDAPGPPGPCPARVAGVEAAGWGAACDPLVKLAFQRANRDTSEAALSGGPCLPRRGGALQWRRNWASAPATQSHRWSGRAALPPRAPLPSHSQGFKAACQSVRFEEVLNLILFKTCNPLKRPTATHRKKREKIRKRKRPCPKHTAREHPL